MDPRPGLRGETTWQFLHRSTWERATETRAFYNESLAVLPASSRQPILRALAAGRTESALLEMLVGRFLQLRGALELEHEAGDQRRKVDWKATFWDGSLHVEAFMPVYNASSGETARRHERLLDVIEQRIPDGWWVIPFHLPAVSGHAPLRQFRKVVDDLLAQLPPAESVPSDSAIRLFGIVQEHRIEFTAVRASGQGGLGGGAMISHFDNSEQVIRAAWSNRRKRAQGRSVPAPALLALAGSFMGPDVEAFDNALFGRDARTSERPDGAMVAEARPPWSGVLVFPTISPAIAPDPILFVAPSYTGPLPAAVARLEVHRLEGHRIDVRPATDRDVSSGMRWAKP
jgi:hypothetical protein